jgi:UDP-N-acetylglucosamine/UDP-N-acetylgalactosamine diphosphorylase
MDKIRKLLDKGARIPDPRTVTIGDDVDIDRLAGQGVTLYPGSRILGADTFIAEGAQLGAEGPVTIENCAVGPHVSLKGGFFSGAVFLQKASCGSGAHVRQGTILEEASSIAHTVGLKQTILFPFVTLGSLINFCDCLMAGGTSRKNHSEVGSSYIHFNFTPNQDKATPSLIGDVPQGVMLNKSPIFLGGQGGLVGPTRLAFGTVLAAGTICRGDQLEENHLVYGGKVRSGKIPYAPGGFSGLNRIIRNNCIYIANLYALRQWYGRIRSQFVGRDLPQELLDALRTTLQTCIDERIRQLGRLSQKLGESRSADGTQHELTAKWPAVEGLLKELESFEGAIEPLDAFSAVVGDKVTEFGKSYLGVIQGFSSEQAAIGTQWLESIVSKVMNELTQYLPGIGTPKPH